MILFDINATPTKPDGGLSLLKVGFEVTNDPWAGLPDPGKIYIPTSFHKQRNVAENQARCIGGTLLWW